MSINTVCKLEEEDTEKLATSGYYVSHVLSGGACSLVYICSKQEGKSSKSKTFVCKVMESIKAPKDFTQKFLPRELANIERIRNGKLSHVIHTHCILQYKSKIFVIMRFAELGSLCDYIRDTKAFIPEKQVFFWFRQMAVALCYLHRMDIVHRDIKCDNVLISSKFNVKLSDFGFSRLSIDQKGKEIYSSTFCGSMGYAAPELLKGIPYNPKLADVWSLGIVLFIMLNKAMPFDQDSLIKLYQAQNKKEYQFKDAVKGLVSPHVIDLVGHMLEPNWFERITSEEILASPWLIDFSPKGQVLTSNEEGIMSQIKVIKKETPKPMRDLIKKNQTSDNIVYLLEEDDSLQDSDQEFTPNMKTSSSFRKSSK